MKKTSAIATALAVALLLVSGSGSSARVPPRAGFQQPRLFAGGLLSAVTAQRAATASATCGKIKGLVCTEVEVPLDRSGAVEGTIPLHVEILSSGKGTRRGTIFLVAGGPGQGSARTFDLGDADSADFYRHLFPGYTLVAYDDRGTGSSDPLDCPGLQDGFSAEPEAQLIADCAASLGPQRAFYGTADHAEDLEAVRQSLGVARVAIWGVSYGTKLALAYALAHPDHVQRLLLDSVVPPEGFDPFGANVLQAMPATLAAYCSGGACRAATPDFAGDVVAVANQLAVTPLQGRIREADGTTIGAQLDALDFLALMVGADVNPGLAAELPAAVRAARIGEPKPLLRVVGLEALGRAPSAADLSAALYLATVCRDGPFPWQPDTASADRPALVQAALAALPAGFFGSFGSWAADIGNADTCVGWPSPAGGATLGAGPLPDVPVLAVSGGLDLRTPTAGAASVVARFPRGHLLVVPGVGHSVLTSDPSGCAQGAVRAWILGHTLPAKCGRAKPFVTALAAFPRAASKRLDARQTRALVAKTVHEAEAAWLMAVASGRQARVPGLFSGALLPAGVGFTLQRYGITPGVTLTGEVLIGEVGPPLAFVGLLRVGGKLAAPGQLRLEGASLRGKLGSTTAAR